MALIEQIRGIDSALANTKTVVGALTTKSTSVGPLIEGFDGSSYVYYSNAVTISGSFSIFGDLENIQGAGNDNQLCAQGGSTGSGGGFRFTYRYGTFRLTFGGVGDYDFNDYNGPTSGTHRWGLTYNHSTNVAILYVDGVLATSTASIATGVLTPAVIPEIIIGAAWNGSSFVDLTGNDARNVNGNLDVYDTLFDATAVLNEYNTYMGGADYPINAATGSIALTGTSATTGKNRFINAASGSHALTGTATTLAKSRNINASSGSYSTAGSLAILGKGYSFNAATGAYTQTGITNTLAYARAFNAAQAAYSLAGIVAGLAVTIVGAYEINSQAGSYVLTGSNATQLNNKVITANPASYTLTGIQGGLTYTQAGQYNLTAQTGTYSTSGFSAGLLDSKAVNAATGSYTYTGSQAGLSKDYSLNAQSGSYATIGTLATFELDTTAFDINAAFGVHAITGMQAQLIIGGRAHSQYPLAGFNQDYPLTGTKQSYPLG